MKKKISFKCISNCSCNSNYYIRIYRRGKIIYNGCIDDINELTLCFLLFRCYTIIIQNCNDFTPMTYILNLYPTNICYQKFFFFFKEQNVRPSIKFMVTDKNYPGLPIEKGELMLCRYNIIYQLQMEREAYL